MLATRILAIALVALLGCKFASAFGYGAIGCPAGMSFCKRGAADAVTPTSLPNCSPSDTFVVYGVMHNSHLWLKFQPSSPADAACGTYIFDSEESVDSATGKEYSVGVLQALSDNVARQRLAGGYALGNVTGAKLLEAIHVFDARVEGQYDPVLNNCGSRVIDVLIFLDLESAINDAALEYVAENLVHGRFVGMVRGSNNLSRLFPGLTRQEIMAKSDSELISHLLRWYLNREVSAYPTTLQQYRSSRTA